MYSEECLGMVMAKTRVTKTLSRTAGGNLLNVALTASTHVFWHGRAVNIAECRSEAQYIEKTQKPPGYRYRGFTGPRY